jgi:hypothetical protein
VQRQDPAEDITAFRAAAPTPARCLRGIWEISATRVAEIPKPRRQPAWGWAIRATRRRESPIAARSPSILPFFRTAATR